MIDCSFSSRRVFFFCLIFTNYVDVREYAYEQSKEQEISLWTSV